MIDSELVQRFDNPPPEYGPTPLWWWSGGTVTEQGILWQLRRFVDGGIMNLVLMNLAPKGPTYGAQPDDPVWFGERWWELFRYTCDRAAELGISLWFYDQIGFSGANIQGQITATHPESTGRSLVSRRTESGENGRVPVLPREHIIGVYDATPSSTGDWNQLDLVDGCVPAGTAGQSIRIVSWRETAFDYLNPDAVALLIDYVHGEYERRVPGHVGTTIVGSFQDELPAMPTWSSTFTDRFRTETGYDLVPVLPALWDHDQERSARIRADYHRVRTALAEDAFFRPLGEWHRDRGMLLGADQMNPARAGVPTQSTQLYGDYFTTHRWFDAVGSDHEGDARVHSSMADLYDHPRVWIESFHSSGWGGTLEETWDWLIPFFRSGANLYNPHASYYGLQAGWFEWAPPSTDFRQPYYEVYPEFATAVARVSALLTWGRHAVDVGLLYPSTSIAAEIPPDLPIDHFLNGDVGPDYPGVDDARRSYLELAGKNDWFRSAPGLLDGAGIDFDIIDDDSLIRSTALGGAAHINGFEFRTMILPKVDRIAPAVADRLVELLDAGGRVIIVGETPLQSAGTSDDHTGDSDLRVRRLADHPRLEVVAAPAAVIDALDGSPRFASAPEGVRAQRRGDLALALVPGAYPNATAFPLRTGIGSGGWDDIDFDADRYSGSRDLRVAGVVTEAELWNPSTGARDPARFTVDGDESSITIDGDGAPLLIAVWRTSDPAISSGGEISEVATGDSADAAPSPLTVAATWTQELVPTLDNRWGDFALPASRAEIPLEIWQLDLVEGDDRTPVRVTFGHEILTTEAVASGELRHLDQGESAGVREGEPLGDERWNVQRYSASYGRDSESGVPQDPKGFISEEFIAFDTPGLGEEVGLRTIIRVDEPGEFDLTVSSAFDTRVWVDGESIALPSDGYDGTGRIRLTRGIAILEARFAAGAEASARKDGRRSTASFSLSLPDNRPSRPEFMAPGESALQNGSATFRRSVTLPSDASGVRIVTGAPSALTVIIDGVVVARQEKVEYYESGLGGNPMYFTHEVGPLESGVHVLEVTIDGAEAQTPLFVDFAADCVEGPVAVPSGRGWSVGPEELAPVLVPALSGTTTHARALRRPHPLPAAHWLSGAPEIGLPSVPFATSASAMPRAQRFEVLVPPGTTEIELSADPESVAIEGCEITVEGRRVILAAPTRAPAIMTVKLADRSFSTSGAAWDGPLIVRTVPTEALFLDWSRQGLQSWSGAVRYATVVEVGPDERVRLELGRVRGAVTVDVDGTRVASAFCAPFTFDLAGLHAGAREISVTVYGTLAPRYASATQSTFFVPSQLRTGITTPIVVTRMREAARS